MKKGSKPLKKGSKPSSAVDRFSESFLLIDFFTVSHQ